MGEVNYQPSRTSTHSIDLLQRHTMRVLSLLTAALLPLTALAAKKAPVDRFEAARTKQLAARGPLALDDKSYEALTRAPRDYAVAVLFTALDSRFACKVCVEFQPEWDLLAASWAKNDKDGESRVVLATLDFLDGKNTFQAVSGEDRQGWGQFEGTGRADSRDS